MVFEYFLEVRGYELDSFQHVNNAVYLHYLEQARWNVFKETNTFAFFEKNRIIPVVIEINIRYIQESRLFEELVVKTELKIEEPYMAFYQDIYKVKTQKKCCAAKVKHLFLDEAKVPSALPEEILKKWGF
ncbi:MAG: acyl-CoA thioesterase [Candidatus Brocadiae bacterium]|nr:acyl-CoA thioesterase [Candidatus Brocadiia bacterium]